MAGVCETCKVKAKSEYWTKLPVTTYKFFKIMLGNFEHELRIPRKFVANFREELPSQCTLRGPSGNEWNVEVREGEDDVLFSRGWEKFVRDHRVQCTDFLVFCYKGNSTFEVFVFDGSGCEREGSYYTLSSDTSCMGTLHLGGRGLTKEASRKEEQSDHASEHMEMSDEHNSKASVEGKSKTRAQRSHYNAVYRGKFKVDKLPKYEDRGNSSSKHERGDDDDDDEEDDDDDEDDDYRGEEEEEEDEESYSHSPELFKVREKRAVSSSGKQAQRTYISNRREVTAREKERASMLASGYIEQKKKTGVPMVGIILLQTHVYKGFHLTIPIEWARNNMLGKDHEVELQVPGKEDYWLVGCRWSRSAQCQLRPRWADFVLDNNLEEGDVCVFELVKKSIKRNTRPVLAVHIFRVVPEVVPLTSIRMV